MNVPVITSLLDTDFYKFTMFQCILHRFPAVNVKVKFKLRTKDVDLSPYVDELNEQFDAYCNLHFAKDEVDYLRGIRFIADDVCDYLEMFQPKRRQLTCVKDPNENGGISIIAEGPWRDVIWFETPVLAIVQEVYMKHLVEAGGKTLDEVFKVGSEKLDEKIKMFGFNSDLGFKLSDFGMRRRFSREWHDLVVKRFAEQIPNVFCGTSDVYLAKKYNLVPIGTFAHELYMGIAGTNVRVSEVQNETLDAWTKEFRGDLGIALSDIFGFNAFLRDFDLYYAKLFDGCRHDSGNPVIWGEMLIDHYKKLRINPMTKTAVFSDSLNPERCIALAKYFKDRIKISFGVGTNLTNDIPGFKPLSMVMKLVESNGTPVCKISDTNGKSMCEDPLTVEYYKKVYDWKSIDTPENFTKYYPEATKIFTSEI